MFWEGTTLESLDGVDSRRFLPHALVATLLTIVAPAVVVVTLSPLSGIADLLVSAVLATGLSVAAGSAGAALWTRLPASREIPFGDLMLWAWARRVRAERQLAKTVSGEAPLEVERELTALRRLSVVFEARDGFSHGHSGRVARHAERIARRLGLPDDEVERIEAAAAVHDVGMVRVPSSVLARRDDPTPEENGLVQRHAVHGAEQVAAVAGLEIAALVRHHHERVDGTGYPDALAGDEIPLGARIIAVADRFDELISPAPQRSPRSRRNALDELSARAGTELDAAVVAAFVGYYSGTRSIAGVALAATAPQRAARWIAAAPATIGSAAGGSVAVQSLCAAGATVIAGVCLSGAPALSPSRDDDPAPPRVAQGSAPGLERQLAAAPGAAAPQPDGDARRGRERSADGLGGGDRPESGTPDRPPGGGDGATPVAPVSGPQQQGDQGPTGGSDGAAPPTGSPSEQPSVEADLPEVSPPPGNSVSRVVDPVLDGVSEAVPPAKPVTDTVKGVLGGLTGGLGGNAGP
ncbi:MAG TPA: HD domain-containing phosphohydrolase [Thermoleophilaceae bacterium]|nr:HD domain-containing phosphohydrolase [Thermoleophilaceae bacterium]